MRKLIAAFACLFLSSCATIVDMNTPPPSDWPELKVIERTAGFAEVQEACGSHWIWTVAVGYTIFACAHISFDEMTCRITYWATDEDTREHELEHCKGRDHIGSSYLRDLWADWKRDNPNWKERTNHENQLTDIQDSHAPAGRQ